MRLIDRVLNRFWPWRKRRFENALLRILGEAGIDQYRQPGETRDEAVRRKYGLDGAALAKRDEQVQQVRRMGGSVYCPDPLLEPLRPDEGLISDCEKGGKNG